MQICTTPSLESTPRFIPSVMSRLTSSFIGQPISVIITTVIIHHSFTLSLQAHNLPFQQILPTLDFFYLLDCLHDNGTGPDLSHSSFYFWFHFLLFLFVPSGGLSWLPVSFLVHVKYTLLYRIVCSPQGHNNLLCNFLRSVVYYLYPHDPRIKSLYPIRICTKLLISANISSMDRYLLISGTSQ